MKPSLQKPAQSSPLNFSPLGGGDLVSAFTALREEVALLRAEVCAQRNEIALLRAAVNPSRPAGEEALPVPPAAWDALEAAGIVNDEHTPRVSRTEAAVLAHVLGGAYGIEGWAPFECACVHFYIKKYCCPEKLEIS